MTHFDAKAENGRVVEWGAETREGPNMLTSVGWTKDTLKTGDQITFVGHPSKAGLKSLRLAKVIFPNGKVLSLDLR